MGILAQTSNYQKCIKKTNIIPDYAREYKNEYLFIRGIDKILEDFILVYIIDGAKELFISRYSNKIKFYIRKFLKAQELDYIKDISGVYFKECDVGNIINIAEKINSIMLIDKELSDDFENDFPGFTDFYELFCKFYDKLNIEFLDSDSDSDIEINIDSGSDSDSD